MSTQKNAQDNPLADFGPNEWIVEDMYQKYLADPASVDPAWHNFFADYKPGSTATGTESTVKPVPTTVTPAVRTAPVAPAVTSSSAPVTQVTPAKPSAPAVQAAPGTNLIKGVSAKLASNMDASLGVPTATSVRAVPAKLLADNRIVINNHLSRGRGGKVSFTHLIGYATIRALADFPEMNNSYALLDGKPALVTPEHVNFGLAIDLKKSDGSRTLVVASIKAAEKFDFRGFWQAYEELVRRARRNELTMEDFSGTTISLTNPGGIGTVHSI
ncbi:MAG: 2-oxo acid dehydrogenase subunit E2, partial [Longispora sp.]|nr:2-oxo acid dehydrogenase subunit E2 [Longispora sp. (in: high G+C Gram-positive bacteria)]